MALEDQEVTSESADPEQKSCQVLEKVSAYAFFLRDCRDKRPTNEPLNFAEFAQNCREKWENTDMQRKRIYEDRARRDVMRYHREMLDYHQKMLNDLTAKEEQEKTSRAGPAPWRYRSAFMWFCDHERPAVKLALLGTADSDNLGAQSMELGRRWSLLPQDHKAIFEAREADDKIRYETELAAYEKVLATVMPAGEEGANSDVPV